MHTKFKAKLYLKYYFIIFIYFIFTLSGEDFQELYGLNKENIYDPTVIPSITQEFASAGFRMLHTLIPVGFKYVLFHMF